MTTNAKFGSRRSRPATWRPSFGGKALTGGRGCGERLRGAQLGAPSLPLTTLRRLSCTCERLGAMC
eukprot:1436067-Prymnesium_polylepis.1